MIEPITRLRCGVSSALICSLSCPHELENNEPTLPLSSLLRRNYLRLSPLTPPVLLFSVLVQMTYPIRPDGLSHAQDGLSYPTQG
jgi:hypothetical protein